MVVKISENQDMKSLLPAPRSHTSFSRCKGVEFKQGCRAKEDVDAVVVRIAQIAEIAYYTCRWIAPVNIEPIMPSMTRYGTYTIGSPPCRWPGSTTARLLYLQPTLNDQPDDTCFQPMRFRNHMFFTWWYLFLHCH
jgi:hypothetical protein